MMHDIIKQKQREYYDRLLAQLREEMVEMETLGYWEAAGKIEEQIREIKKRRDEAAK